MHPTAGPVAVPPHHPEVFPAHRALVEALLQAGEADPARPSYALLWEDAAVEQRRAGRDGAEAEAAVELLVTEVMALARTAEWFRAGAPQREAAIAETIAFWAAGAGVASARAHEVWRQCTRSRATVTRHVALAHADLAAAIAAERRLQREWSRAWAEWADRFALAAL